MGEDEPAPVQLTLQGDELADETRAGPKSPRGAVADPVEPGAESGYALAVKPGALAVNDALVEAVDAHGRTLEFASRARAETYADQLSAEDGALRVQAAAPNDPGDADGYLLADHDPSIAEPAEVDGDTWTFDVGANLYGALGEAILLEPPTPHALYYFVRRDLGIGLDGGGDEDDGDGGADDGGGDDDDGGGSGDSIGGLDRGLHLDVATGTVVSLGDDDSDGRTAWVPDCTIEARDGWDGPVVERYYCEIKTGNASFERSQVATMERLARDERVLTIRMLVDELPDQYSLRIREVEASE